MLTLGPADVADAPALLRAIERGLPGVVTTEGAGDWYVFYDPDGRTRPDARFPFCTLMTGDRYDAASDLDRDPATYRVNLGVGADTYRARFGPAPREAVGTTVIDTGHDYTATDIVMPHPFYAPLHWVCVVNPGERTTADVAALLVEAHALDRHRYERRTQERRPGH